jgi:hypothetical protein
MLLVSSEGKLQMEMEERCGTSRQREVANRLKQRFQP